MVVDILVRWGPLILLLFSLAAYVGHTFWLRSRSSLAAEPAATDSAPAFMREVLRRAVGVMLLYFLCRAFFPQLEQDFGRIDTLATTAVRLTGLALSFIGVLWLVTAQITLGEHWDVGVPVTTLPNLVHAVPFSASRNPVLLGVVAEAIGLFLTSPTAVTLMALTATWLSAQLQVRLEEDTLRKAYGPDYVDYCTRVRRWL